MDWLLWLSDNALAVTMRRSLWLYPAAEALHIIGLVVMIGAAAMFDLRLLGISRQLSVTTLSRFLLPWSRLGFFVVVVTGLLMFTVDAVGFAGNPAFQLKLVLIGLSGINILVFHRYTFKSVSTWDKNDMPTLAARFAGGLSLLLWTVVIVAGRLVAYV